MGPSKERRRGQRLTRILVAALLAMTAAVGLGTEPAGALAPNVLNIGPFGTSTAVVSGYGSFFLRDGGYSVPVAGNRSLWIFDDTMRFNKQGKLDNGSIQGSAAFAYNNVNPAMVWESIKPTGAIYKLLEAATEPCPPNESSFAWPTSVSGVPQPDPNYTLVVIYYESLCGPTGGVLPTPQHVGVATFWYDATKPSAPVQATVLNKNLFPMDPEYGFASVYNPVDGNVYVYGCATKPCRVARVPSGSVGNLAAYRYWTGTTWSANAAQATGVTMMDPTSLSLTVQWMPELNRYVSMDTNSNSRFSFRTATSPEGPWSASSKLTIPECANGCMTPGLHAAISTSSALGISYVPVDTHYPQLAFVPIQVDPFGAVDSLSATANKLHLTGWAIDPDTTASIPVGVFVDNVPRGYYTANVARGDVATANPGYGPNHGFDIQLSSATGQHTVCVRAVNAVMGSAAPSLGCKSVTVYSAPSAPQNPTAFAGDAQALVTWQPPIDTGGAAVDSLTYSVDVSPPAPGAPFTVAPGQTSLLVNGLTNETPYAFTITATNATQPGGSATTAPVTPHAIAGAGFHVMSPTRVLDSRTGPGWTGKLSASTPRALTVTGSNGVPTTASAVVMNVTATNSDTPSFMTVYPEGMPKPNASNLNFAANQTIPNLVTVRVGAGGAVDFATALGTTDVVADLVGWYDDGAAPGDLYNPMNPTRFLDSRTGTGWTGPLQAGTTRTLAVRGVNGVPATATAVVMNVTATGSTAASFVTAFPGGQPKPNASNLNFAAGETIPNLVTVKIGTGGAVAFATAAGATDLVADVVGWYEPGTGQRLHTLLAPTRILDDRFGIGGFTTPVTAAAPRLLPVWGTNGVTATSPALVVNTTVTQSTAPSFVTVYPGGQPKPNASNLNFAANQTIPNLVITKIGPGGKIQIATEVGAVSVIMDATAYFDAT